MADSPLFPLQVVAVSGAFFTADHRIFKAPAAPPKDDYVQLSVSVRLGRGVGVCKQLWSCKQASQQEQDLGGREGGITTRLLLQWGLPKAAVGRIEHKSMIS
jgi:hypothetical protein